MTYTQKTRRTWDLQNHQELGQLISRPIEIERPEWIEATE